MADDLPVDYNPLRITINPGTLTNVPTSPLPVQYNDIDPLTGNPIPPAPDLNGPDKLAGFVPWWQRMAVSGATAPGDAYAGRLPIESPTGYPGSIAPSPIPSSESEIARVQDLAGMAGMSGIGMTPKGALGTAGSKAIAEGESGIGAVNQSGFYSNLERTIANSKVDKATPEQWQSYLRNQPGIKSEELEFGLSNLPDRVLSKAELEQHIAENGVKLGEVWKGNLTDEQLNAKIKSIFGKNSKYDELNPYEQKRILDEIGGPKYSSYQLPGGENYRELLLTVPEKINKRLDEVNNRLDEITKMRSSYHAEHPELITEFDALMKERGPLMAELNQQQSYKSSHWDEPNVLAHIRMNDREIPNVGKTLHIEEIQSDWHQAGRKQGYKQKKTGNWELVKTDNGYRIESEGTPIWEGVSRETAEQKLADFKERQVTLDKGIPNAPFKKSWDELALKRVLTEAVKNNYDAVSWTPGEAQAARYDLSKQIKRLHYTKTDQGYLLAPETHTGHEAAINQGQAIPANKLADYVGKDIAEKIINNIDVGTLENVDLKVGGEGMKAFYDKMLPAKASTIIKKMGGKVEYEHLPTDKGANKYKVVNRETGEVLKEFEYEHDANVYRAQNNLIGEVRLIPSDERVKNKGDRVPIIRITPQMREKIKNEGFPLFTAPVYIPVNEQPDFGDKKQVKLTPIVGNPFQ